MSKPYTPQPTRTRFYVPPTLAADFTEFLDGDIPNQVMDFTLIKDWAKKNKGEENGEIIRGELYGDTAKSRYINTDNNLNIRCDVNSGIRKGDMVIASNDETVYLLDWHVALQSNNAPSRALRCNLMLEIKRYRPEKTDYLGYLEQPEGEDVIVSPTPCNAYRYEGRPEYTSNSEMPGMVPNALTEVSVQYNEETQNINVKDRFQWDDSWYEVIDIDRVGVDIYNRFGVLKLQARKQAGGITA